MSEKPKENIQDQSATNLSVQVEKDDTKAEIVEVWEDNFEEEMEKISDLLRVYNYVAMDTEFPGICIQGETITGYNLIRSNVDALKLIQVGISLSDEQGNSPPVSTWQFNLKFDLKADQSSPESIDMLKEAGINFDELAEKGIEPLHFADVVFSSGLLLNEDVKWITFHGAFDFAYLIKVVSNTALPGTQEKFNTTLKLYFPSVYDIKIIMKEVNELRSGSLSKLARDLELKRIGTMHQAGSDSELTLRCFFKLKEYYFKNGIQERLCNKVFGLNFDFPATAAPEVRMRPSNNQIDGQGANIGIYQPIHTPTSMSFYGYNTAADVSGNMYYLEYPTPPMIYPSTTSPWVGRVHEYPHNY
jgi:CCR4-NOT transcription complex subunit 7/8